MTFSEFLRRAKIAHADKYDYSVTQITTQHVSVEVICPIHGKFTVSPSNHIKNYDNANPDPRYRPVGCGECGKDFTRTRNRLGMDTKEVFVAKANEVHNDRYTYPGEYSGQNFKVDINCVDHGVFKQSGLNHLRGSGCPKCKNSRGETIIAKWLTRLNIEYVQEFTFPECMGDSKPLRFDFWLPTYNTLIEYDGEHHFEPIRFRGTSIEQADERYQQGLRYDSIKTEYAEAHGIRLLRVPYFKKSAIKEILNEMLA